MYGELIARHSFGGFMHMARDDLTVPPLHQRRGDGEGRGLVTAFLQHVEDNAVVNDVINAMVQWIFVC